MIAPAARRMFASLLILGACLALSAAVAAVDVGAAGRWAFDETSGAVAADSVGSLAGAIHGAAHVGDGFDNGAFRFDGSDDVTIPSAAVLRTGDMALSLWVRANPNAAPTTGEVIADNGTILCGGNGYALVVTGSSAKVVFRDALPGVGIVTLQPSPQIVLPNVWDGSWHHVAVGARAGDWGFVYLFIDGRHVASTSASVDSSHGIAYGASPNHPLMIGDDDGSCGPGFVGDIDDVRMFDHLVQRDELAGLEPPIETTLEITAIDPASVNISGADWVGVDVTLLPAPAMPGTFWVYVTADDGIERPSQRFDLETWAATADGHYHLAFITDYGGESTVRVEYLPETPALASQATAQVTIAKAPTETHVQFDTIDVANDPITVGVQVSTPGKAPVTGTVELWDVSNTPTLIGQAEVGGIVSGTGGAAFNLPGRPEGDYQFEATYFGSAANNPSQSLPATLTVLPGMETGGVVINGGAATTDDPIVEVSAPATGAIGIMVTTDPTDIRRQFQLPYTESFTTWLTQPWFGDDTDGVRTIWVKWADAKSRWSDWSTDTIVLDRPPAGTTTIEAGAGYTRDSQVSVAVPIGDPQSVDAVQLSNDGSTWTTFQYAPIVQWNLSAGAGTKSVRARWVNTNGIASMSVADTIIFDTNAPTTSGLTNAFLAGANVAGGSVPVRLTWSGSDATSGVARYELARSRDGGSFSLVTASLPVNVTTRALEPGHSYRFRVRAVDRAGNVGAWAYGSSFRLSSAQEWGSRIAYKGAWRTSSSSAAWGGGTRYATAAGANARIKVSARSFAWIAPIGPSSGTARVFVDGTLVATINLYASSTSARELVFAKTWASARTRTIEIRIRGTLGHPRVDVDGFVWGT